MKLKGNLKNLKTELLLIFLKYSTFEGRRGRGRPRWRWTQDIGEWMGIYCGGWKTST